VIEVCPWPIWTTGHSVSILHYYLVCLVGTNYFHWWWWRSVDLTLWLMKKMGASYPVSLLENSVFVITWQRIQWLPVLVSVCCIWNYSVALEGTSKGTLITFLEESSQSFAKSTLIPTEPWLHQEWEKNRHYTSPNMDCSHSAERTTNFSQQPRKTPRAINN
jgi:hypothetical protein